MSDDLTPQGAAAVRLALDVVRLKAERDRARGIAVGLEQRLARVEATIDRVRSMADRCEARATKDRSDASGSALSLGRVEALLRRAENYDLVAAGLRAALDADQ